MSILSDFLLRSNAVAKGTLPLVHTTRALHLKTICASNRIVPASCDVFKGQDLTYFFMGRPAYKYHSTELEAEYWQLPCCFVFEFSSVQKIDRIFPFDSGAFKRGRYPGYINEMELNDFEASAAPDAASKIVGAFFETTSRYFRLTNKGQEEFEKEFQLGVFDAEIKALHRLSREKSAELFYDRRFSIELQSSEVLDLTLKTPLAVIVPMTYLDDRDFRDQLESGWKCIPLGYPTYAFNSHHHYYAIYERVRRRSLDRRVFCSERRCQGQLHSLRIFTSALTYPSFLIPTSRRIRVISSYKISTRNFSLRTFARLI